MSGKFFLYVVVTMLVMIFCAATQYYVFRERLVPAVCEYDTVACVGAGRFIPAAGRGFHSA